MDVPEEILVKFVSNVAVAWLAFPLSRIKISVHRPDIKTGISWVSRLIPGYCFVVDRCHILPRNFQLSIYDIIPLCAT